MNGDALPFVTGAMLPNCLEAVLSGLGGLSVAFHVPEVSDAGLKYASWLEFRRRY
jgi:hypothetical protein